MTSKKAILRALREAFLAGFECGGEGPTEEGCEYDPEARADELLALLEEQEQGVEDVPR